MNKIVTSVGLFALGASALHAVESSTLNSAQDTKAWSVQATLRGFYDDNVNTAPSGSEIDSFGLQVSPSVKFGMPGEQTSFNVGYGFTGMFYDKNPGGRDGKSDYTHTFDADLAHAFSPRFDVAVSESFVIGQEPDRLQDPAGTQRIDGDNVRNFASIDFNLVATDLLSFGFGYNNAYYNYDDEANYAAGTLVGYSPNPPSNSGLLDRLEHGVSLDSRWRLTPQTTGLIGYSFSQINYTGDETVLGIVGAPGSVMSDTRDTRGHTISVGASHVFSPTLSGTVRAGGQYFNQFNDPADNAEWSPYAQGSLSYALQTTTTVDLGASYSRQVANTAGNTGTQFVRDTETATVYGNLKHELAPKLIGTFNVTASDSKYNGGGAGFDGQHYKYYRVGLDLAYDFTQNFSGSIGYNFDKLDSDLQGRSYDRNRFYLGVTAGF